jgi:hypothetical protein
MHETGHMLILIQSLSLVLWFNNTALSQFQPVAEHDFKMTDDEETRRALFLSNYPPEESSCPAKTWRVEND